MPMIAIQPLFALGFGAPALLWGAGLAATPVILHLLFRRKYKQVDWAAMKWLLDAMKKNHRRLRMEQWLLLAVRTLLILLVVLAMARPATDAPNPLIAATASSAVHNVIVFDNSMSMHYQTGNQSRWDRAKGLAQSVLDDAQKGDLASLVVMGMPATAVVGDASPYLVSVSEEIDAIAVQHGVAEIEPAVDLVAEIVNNSSASRKRVYFITDMQRHTWLGEESGEPADLARKLRSLSERAECVILDVGADESPNLAVTGLEQVDPVAVVRRPSVIRAEVSNFSSQDADNVRVEILVDGQVEATRQVNIAAGERQTVNFGLTFVEAGDRVVEVRLPSDALRADDRRWLVSRVRNSLSVLLIDGEPSGEPFKSETDYLRTALAPQADDGVPGLIRAEVKLESDLLEANLDEWDMIALCNVGQFTPSELSVLADYLRRGGGVLFFLGKQTNAAAYNELAFAAGEGILPVRLLGTVGDANDRENHVSFDPLNYAHPVVADFQDHEQAGLLSTRIFRYFRAELPPESSAQIVLAYDTGDPAAVLQSYGAGTVGVVTTSADLDWNTWAISPSFVPVVQELTLQLVAGRVRRENFLVGEPLEATVPGRQAQAQATIAAPGAEQPRTVRAQEVDGLGRFVFDETDLNGEYRMRLTSPVEEEWAFAVNAWPNESDLSHMVAEDLRASFAGWDFRISDRFESPRSMAATSDARSGEFHRLLLYAALALVFFETYLAWKFGHHAATG